MGTPEEDYVDELLLRLRHPDEQRQKLAVRALAREGRKVVPALLELLRGEELPLRRLAAAVFAEAPDPRALPVLCEALQDVDWEVRREAARALKAVAAPEAACPLLEAQDHPQVRLITIEALAAIRERDSGGQVPSEVWERAAIMLCAAVASDQWRVQCAAAALLGDLGAGGAVDALWAALGDAELEPALRMVEALGKIGGARVVEPLRVALSHREPKVRAAAAEAFGRVGGEESLMLLCWALRAQDPFLRRGAAQAVARLARVEPSPALRAVRAPLRRLLSPLAWPPPGADRSVFIQALREVELATAQVRDLPLPSSRKQQRAPLPLPADAHSNRAGGAPSESAECESPAQ